MITNTVTTFAQNGLERSVAFDKPTSDYIFSTLGEPTIVASTAEGVTRQLQYVGGALILGVMDELGANEAGQRVLDTVDEYAHASHLTRFLLFEIQPPGVKWGWQPDSDKSPLEAAQDDLWEKVFHAGVCFRLLGQFALQMVQAPDTRYVVTQPPFMQYGDFHSYQRSNSQREDKGSYEGSKWLGNLLGTEQVASSVLTLHRSNQIYLPCSNLTTHTMDPTEHYVSDIRTELSKDEDGALGVRMNGLGYVIRQEGLGFNVRPTRYNPEELAEWGAFLLHNSLRS